jgi:F-type H+-transporting ATPase subunit a
MPLLHLYFDFFDGTIQALIFSLLTIVYWQIAIEGEKKNLSFSKKKIYN